MEYINRLQQLLSNNVGVPISKLAKVFIDGINSGSEMYGSAIQPAPPEIVKGTLGFTPGIGDAISAYDAYDASRQGNYGEAALDAIGLIPGIPSLGAAAKVAGTIAAPAAVMAAIGKAADVKGVMTNGSRLAEAINSQAGMIKNVGLIPKNALYPAEFHGLVKKGLGNLPESKTWDAAGNVIDDMTANIRPMTDGNFIVTANPPWGRKNKPFYAVGDDPEELSTYALDRLARGDRSIQAAADRTLLGQLKKQYGDQAFQLGKSTQSKSQYITHIPSGTKIRISDHDLPLHYEQPDVDLRIGTPKDEMLSIIRKVIGNE